MNKFLETITEGPRILIVCGHFGSGKTEFSVSLAFALAHLRNEGRISGDLALCDLDVENPYFRSRELTEEMEKEGIFVYSDPYHGKNGSELQTLDPAILAPVENKNCRVILDTGGNASGAMILNQFRRHYGENYQMIYVVNKFRPGTDTPDKILTEIQEIERTTSLNVTGLISNSHLIWETREADVSEGLAFAKEVGAAAGLPVLCACCHKDLAVKMKSCGDIDIFPVGMYMRKSYLDKKLSGRS
ncbi:MAG: hypothetical protein K6E30_10475 [Lachnospiraceae bacterium]|nr:hypothetical protein [Lachnospiraceae bacterium]